MRDESCDDSVFFLDGVCLSKFRVDDVARSYRAEPHVAAPGSAAKKGLANGGASGHSGTPRCRTAPVLHHPANVLFAHRPQIMYPKSINTSRDVESKHSS